VKRGLGLSPHGCSGFLANHCTLHYMGRDIVYRHARKPLRVLGVIFRLLASRPIASASDLSMRQRTTGRLECDENPVVPRD